MKRVRYERVDFALSAVRDVRGSAHLPVDAAAPCPARLTRVAGTASVVTEDPKLDAAALAAIGHIVHERCPVANMFEASGCALDIEWRLARDASET
mmetsp:Transcript_17938/g.55179  ORF Transcript_17938/g.55179 Transcript_17938/m.55179 type:complete len:96 (+) Transcript_17938:67-354(+)